MFLDLLDGIDPFWSVTLVALWIWTAVLVFDRSFARLAHRRRTARLQTQIERARSIWLRVERDAEDGVDNRATARAKTANHAPEIARALDRDPGASRVDVRAAIVDRQLSLVARIGPLLGLAGTVAGYQGTFQELVATGSPGGLAAIAGPVALAMKTTLGGLIPAIAAPMAQSLIRIDPRCRAENLLLRKASRELRMVTTKLNDQFDTLQDEQTPSPEAA